MTSLTLANPALPLRKQGTVFLISIGHGATHWLLGTFFILLPYLTTDLGLSYTQAGMLVATLQGASLLSNLAGGVAADLSGRRVVFMVGCLLLGGGALLVFGLTPVYWMLPICVAMIAIAGSFWHAPAIAYISENYAAYRGYALSIHSMGASFGEMVAPGVAGMMLLWLSWQQTAAVHALPALLLVLPLAWRLLPQERGRKAAAGKAQLSLQDYLVLLGNMLRRLPVLMLCLLTALRGMAQTGMIMFVPLYMVQTLEVSPMVVGGTMMGMHLGGVVMSPVAGAFSDRYGRWPVVLVGLLATSAIVVGLVFTQSPWQFVLGVALYGFGMYSIHPVLQTWMIELAPEQLRGSATSIFFSTLSILSIVTPLIGGWVGDRYSLFHVFYLIAGLTLLANVAFLLLPRESARAT